MTPATFIITVCSGVTGVSRYKQQQENAKEKDDAAQGQRRRRDALHLNLPSLFMFEENLGACS